MNSLKLETVWNVYPNMLKGILCYLNHAYEVILDDSACYKTHATATTAKKGKRVQVLRSSAISVTAIVLFYDTFNFPFPPLPFTNWRAEDEGC